MGLLVHKRYLAEGSCSSTWGQTDHCIECQERVSLGSDGQEVCAPMHACMCTCVRMHACMCTCARMHACMHAYVRVLTGGWLPSSVELVMVLFPGSSEDMLIGDSHHCSRSPLALLRSLLPFNCGSLKGCFLLRVCSVQGAGVDVFLGFWIKGWGPDVMLPRAGVHVLKGWLKNRQGYRKEPRNLFEKLERSLFSLVESRES